MKRSRLRGMSAKRRADNRVRRDIFERMVDRYGPWCMLRSEVCTGQAQACHELIGRNHYPAGVTDESVQVLACNPCNGWVEDNPALARVFGWKVRAGSHGVERARGAAGRIRDRWDFRSDAEGEALPGGAA